MQLYLSPLSHFASPFLQTYLPRPRCLRPRSPLRHGFRLQYRSTMGNAIEDISTTKTVNPITVQIVFCENSLSETESYRFNLLQNLESWTHPIKNVDSSKEYSHSRSLLPELLNLSQLRSIYDWVREK